MGILEWEKKENNINIQLAVVVPFPRCAYSIVQFHLTISSAILSMTLGTSFKVYMLSISADSKAA